MFVHLFYLLLRILPEITGQNSPTLEEIKINQEKHSLCTLYIVRSHIANSIKLETFNSWLEQTFVSNQHVLFARVITDSFNPVLNKQFQSIARSKDSNYTTYRHFNLIHSCNLIITDLTQIVSGINHGQRYEKLLFLAWGLWLKKASVWGLLPISTGQTQLLALTQNQKWMLPLAYWDTIYTSPVLMFVLTLTTVSSTPKVTSIKWACYNCEPDKKIFLKEHPYTNEIASQFLTAFDVNIDLNFPQNFFLASIIINSAIADKKVTCRRRVSLKEMLSKYDPNLHKELFHTICTDIRWFLADELSTYFNFTTIHGDMLLRTRPPFRYKANIVYMFTRGDYREFKFRDHGILIFEDKSHNMPGYCDLVGSFELISSFELLANPLHHLVWICLGLSCVAIFLYAHVRRQLTTPGDVATKPFEIAFDIVSIVLQQGTKYFMSPLSVLFLTISFIIAFYYEFDMTSKLVVPPKLYVRETLTELLGEGFQIAIDVSGDYNNPVFIKRFKEVMIHSFNFELIKEGFNGDIRAPEHWYLYNGTTNSHEDEDGFLLLIRKPKIIQTLSEFTLLPTSDVQGVGEKGQNCHVVPRWYGEITAFFGVYSVNRREYAMILNKLLYESGVRYFWISVVREFRRRKREENSIASEELLMVVKLDERFYALLIISGVMMTFGCVSFLLEQKFVSRLFCKNA